MCDIINLYYLRGLNINVMVNDYVLNPQLLKDKRVKLTEPMNDPHPIEVGSEGVVYNVGYDVVNVRWDNGRSLGLIIGQDIFEIIN
jgi:hypothetical protein